MHGRPLALVVTLAIVLAAAPATPAGAQAAGDPQRGEVTLRCATDDRQPWVAFEVTATVHLAYTGSFRWVESVDEAELRLTDVLSGVQLLAGDAGAQVDTERGTALVWGQVLFNQGWMTAPFHLATCLAEYDPYHRDAPLLTPTPAPAPPVEDETPAPAAPSGDQPRFTAR